jgi:UDP-N-acetylmuramate: L-alanyl-gamma-D-glutamyl-meso-diaminopimelate ligase
MDSYRAAFARFVELLPADGLLVANAADPEVRAVARQAPCRVSWFSLSGEDTGDLTPTWLAAAAPPEAAAQPFDLFFGGSSCGRVLSPLAGRHNVRNAVAAIAAAAEGAGAAVRDLTRALPRFGGVRRRQELRGTANGVRVYDDFAHHPTAVAETLLALKGRHKQGKLIAIFEPRSATASRKLHQDEYARAFAAADVTLLAPVGRPEIPDAERLDVARIAAQIRERGGAAETPADLAAILDRALAVARPGDAIVVMSNGAFGDIHNKLLARLAIGLIEQRLG